MAHEFDQASPPAVAVFRLQLFKPSETFIADQARCLSRYQPFLLGRERMGTAAAPIDYCLPDPVGRLGQLRRKLLGATDAYRQILAARRAVVAHAHFGIDAAALLDAVRAADIPLVTTFHGYDVTTQPARFLRSGSPTLIRYALRRQRLAREGQRFICVSEFIKQKALALGFPEDRVVKHYIGTDIRRFSGVMPEFGQHRPTILHVARLVEKKGTADLLHAFAELRKHVRDARVVIVGDGPLQFGSDDVVFTGALPHADVIAWFKQASVFCLPSVTAANGDSEGLPISIMEAAAAGLPIVSTWHSGIPEAVTDGEGGLLVQERDRAALADALVQVLQDSSLASRLGGGARRHVEANFDLVAQGRKLEQIYDDARR